MLYFKDAKQISRSKRKSVMSQYLEIIKLRFSRSLLGPSEYYIYGLYDDSLYSPSEKKEFLGWRAESLLDKKLNADTWRAIANDKLIFYSTLQVSEICYPKIKAVFHTHSRPFKGALLLRTLDEAAEYLRNRENYPFFLKPIHGSYGRGAMSVIDFDPKNDILRLGSADTMLVSHVLGILIQDWTGGYLFQELVTPCDPIKAVCGGQRVSSVRIIIILTPKKGPLLFRAVWKVPTGSNMSDNFMHGKTGNLLGDIDLNTGIVTRVVGNSRGLINDASKHPDTGKCLIGFPIPFWKDVCKVCLRGAACYPGLKMQHWDIALAKSGPVALEVNVEGSIDLTQIAAKRGIWDDTLRRNFPSC